MTIPKPVQREEYKTPTSTNLIKALSAIMLIAGILMLLLGIINSGNPTTFPIAIYGVSCIIISGLLFIICNLSEDVHRLTYLAERYIKSDIDTQGFILAHLRSIEEKLDK